MRKSTDICEVIVDASVTRNKTNYESIELDQLHRRCGLNSVAIDSVVLGQGRLDYQLYVNTKPELT